MISFLILSFSPADPFLGSGTNEDGLVAFYSFDEAPGEIVRDASGNGHHGMLKNVYRVKGKSGSAVEFNGEGWIEIPDHEDLRLTGDFTITAWVFKSEKSVCGKSMGIVSKSSIGSWDYDLFMSTSLLEHPAFYSDAFEASGGDIEIIADTPISPDHWYHITVTRMDDRGNIYIDGELAGLAHVPESLNTSSSNLRIGHDHDGGFVGIIDEVRIYDRCLDEEEIRHLIGTAAQSQTAMDFHHVVVDSSFGGIRKLADMNGDGFIDIVHCYWYDGAPLAWFEFRKNGSWKKHVIEEAFYPVTDNFDVQDMDVDGDIDIVISRSDHKSSSDPEADFVSIDSVQVVWLENPHGQKKTADDRWKSQVIGHHNDPEENYIKDIKAADFTGDGRFEIVVRSGVAISIFMNNGNFSWQKIQYFPVHPHEGMDVGDLDCDGDPDIVLNGFWLECPEDPANDHWKEHNIDAKWWNQTGDWTANNCKVVVSDINADGCADILLSHSERPGYPVSWYSAHPVEEDVWVEHVIDSLDFCHTLQVADMDLDGHVDIVAGEMEKSTDPHLLVFYLNMKGDGMEWEKKMISRLGTYSAIVGDIGQDGDMDIVSNRNFNKPPLEIWVNTLNEKQLE
jgi:hypothetical protein